jgi:hypothetical protein
MKADQWKSNKKRAERAKKKPAKRLVKAVKKRK